MSWRRAGLGGIALLMSTVLHAAPDAGAEVAWAGQWRWLWEPRQTNPVGPLAEANARASGIATLPVSGAAVEAELRATAARWNATTTLRGVAEAGRASVLQGVVNEAALQGEALGWQWSAGRRIVAWDVGHGFRPNDVVQQEARRTLVPVLPVGRDVMMAERFAEGAAWSLVMVHPTHQRSERGAREPALAARWYGRDGAVDMHGFARQGARTGTSLGAAWAWVASDALELHTSWRVLRHHDGLEAPTDPARLYGATPWTLVTMGATRQALLGGTWTEASQVSLMAEVWWDGTALDDARWAALNARQVALVRLPASAAGGPPVAAVAGNLAWEADALGASTSLRRRNVFLRASRDQGTWQPAIDLLWHPADGGRVLTAGLTYQGDRWRLQGAWRRYGGPSSSVLGQLPTHQQFTLAATWGF